MGTLGIAFIDEIFRWQLGLNADGVFGAEFGEPGRFWFLAATVVVGPEDPEVRRQLALPRGVIGEYLTVTVCSAGLKERHDLIAEHELEVDDQTLELERYDRMSIVQYVAKIVAGFKAEVEPGAEFAEAFHRYFEKFVVVDYESD